MPNQPRTPLRNIRIPDELWEAAQRQAEREGISVSEAVRRCLEVWVSSAEDRD